MKRAVCSVLPPHVATGRAARPQRSFSTFHPDPVQITTLANQLRIVTGDTSGHFSSVGVYIDAGSRYEWLKTSGTSHVLDRMAFKSTETRDAVEMSKAVDSLGGQVLCSSSRETMMYQSSHFTSATPLAISLLADVVRRPLFLPEELDAQRDAAAYEIREINNKPEMILPEILHQVAFQNNTLGNPLLCPEERLPRIDDELLKEFVRTWFRPDRMVIAGSGIEHNDLVKLVEERFGDLRTPTKPLEVTPPSPSRSIPAHLLSAAASSPSRLHKSLTTAAASFLKPRPVAEPTFEELASARARYTGGQIFLHRPEEQYNHIYVAFEGVSIHDDDVYTLAAMQMLLGGGGSFSAGGPGKGMYSRLYTHVLNHHPAIDHCSSLHHIYTDSSLFGIMGTSYPSLRPKDLLPTLIHQLSLLLYNPVSERELQRAKNQLMSSLVMALESRMVEVEDLGRQVIVHGRRVPVTEMCRKIEAITPADLMRVANRVFGPHAEGEPTLLVMGREDVPDWKAAMRQYGVGRID